MRMIAFAISLIATGCSAVSSGPFEAPRPGQLALAGLPYSLPKAVVPVKVFVGPQGVGLAIEEPQIVADPATGTLVARLQPSPFNKEDMKLTANPVTGLLISVSSESEAKLLAIVEELAKTVGRASATKSMMTFFTTNTPIFEDAFDPLSKDDTTRIETAINAALARATITPPPAVAAGQTISLTVQMADEDWRNSSPLRKRQETQPASLANCQTGVCVRAMTSRVIRVSSINGATLATKPISVPSREAIAVPVPQTILANQKVTVAIKDGIASGYDLQRESELLGIVKIPGTVLSGIVAGVTQGLTDQKSIADQLKALADAQAALAEAEKKRRDAVDKGTDSGSAAYAASTLVVYPFGPATRR